MELDMERLSALIPIELRIQPLVKLTNKSPLLMYIQMVRGFMGANGENLNLHMTSSWKWRRRAVDVVTCSC